MRKVFFIIVLVLFFQVLPSFCENIASEESVEEEDTEPQVIMRAIVNASDGLIMRGGPSRDALKIMTIKPGSIVEIVEKCPNKESINGREDYWYKGWFSGKEGFAFGGYLKLIDKAGVNGVEKTTNIVSSNKSMAVSTEIVEKPLTFGVEELVKWGRGVYRSGDVDEIDIERDFGRPLIKWSEADLDNLSKAIEKYVKVDTNVLDAVVRDGCYYASSRLKINDMLCKVKDCRKKREDLLKKKVEEKEEEERKRIKAEEEQKKKQKEERQEKEERENQEKQKKQKEAQLKIEKEAEQRELENIPEGFTYQEYGPKIKGLSLGMCVIEARKTLIAKFPNDKSWTIIKDGAGFVLYGSSGFRVEADSNKCVRAITINTASVFDALDLSPEEFAKQIVENYKIPELKSFTKPGSHFFSQGWAHSSVDGWKIEITVNKMVAITTIPKASERKFD